MATWAYNTGNWLFRPIFRVALDLCIDGLDNLPRNGSVLIALNHTSFIDPLLLAAFAPRPIVMMSKLENFHIPIVGGFVRLYGAFPVTRGTVDREAMRTALGVLEQGGVLLMAPEGTRSKDGALQKGRDGVALLAAKTGAPVLPVAVAGAHRLAGNLRRLRRTRIAVRVGDPMQLTDAGERASREKLTAFTDRLMRAIAALLPESQRGVYTASAGSGDAA